MKKTRSMNRQEWCFTYATSIVIFSFALLLGCVVLTPAQAITRLPKDQRFFGTAGEAAQAITEASANFDQAALKEILGPYSLDIINSGDPDADKQVAADFAALAKAKTKITYDPRNRSRATMNIGPDDWPFAIPLVKVSGKWIFDTAAGRKELLYRRIGRNELDAIAACRGYVEAQNEYALEKHDRALVNQYAQRLISSPGKKDGLAWQNPDGTWGGTVGENAAKELERSYTGKRAPFHGYYFKILKGQGPTAPLGQLDYVLNGAMIGGFALVAYPASYRYSGVKTFLVSQDGVVWEKDLGEETPKLAEAIELFNPDKTWNPVLNDE